MIRQWTLFHVRIGPKRKRGYSFVTALLVVIVLRGVEPLFSLSRPLRKALTGNGIVQRSMMVQDASVTAKFSKKREQQRPTRTIKQLFRSAKDLERKGQWRKATLLLQSILELDPTDAHSHLALARLLARRQMPNAGQAFRNGTTVCPNSIHLWQAWAVYEESIGSCQTAKHLFEQALVLDPYNPYVCHAYGRMERKLGNRESAIQLWEKALQHTSTAALVCSLGELWIAEKKFELARDLYALHAQRVETEREKTEIYLAYAWLEERYFENFDRAEDMIQKALSCSPRSSVALVALARLEGRRRQKQQGELLDDKEATVRRLASTCIGSENGSADRQPEDGRVFNAWASMEVKSRRYKTARKILQKGLDRYPEDHSLLQAAGKVEERLGNFTGARNLYSTSLLVEPSAPTLVAFALLEVRHPEHGQQRNISKVMGLFEEALLLDPRHGPAYNAYAKTVLERTADVDRARHIFERGVRANCPDAASIYHGYARLELSLGNVERARELLLEGQAEVQRQDVGMDNVHRERALFLTHTLGMLELNRKHPSDALQVFREGIDRYGNSSQLLLGAALCEMMLGREENARSLFEQSVSSDEKHAQAWQAWGVMEMRAGNVKAAKTLFECGIKHTPRHGALWQAYATMESRMGHIENARVLFQTGIKKSPRHAPLYQSWAQMELREGNFMAAKALIAQALTRDKQNGSGWLIAAEIEERLENEGLAGLLLRRGIECAPTTAHLYQALGDSLLRKGRINEAREIYEKGIEIDPLCAPLYHSLAELEARVFNVEGLSRLNKRAAKVFSPNALEPPAASSEVWAAKIKAKRSRHVPRGVTALAQRIVEEDGSIDIIVDEVDPGTFLDSMSSSLLEEGLVGQLLTLDDETIKGSSTMNP